MSDPIQRPHNAMTNHPAGQEVLNELESLRQWKKEALQVESWWSEVDAFIRRHKETTLGDAVPSITLRFLEERDDLECNLEVLQSRLARLEKRIAELERENAALEYVLRLEIADLDDDIIGLDIGGPSIEHLRQRIERLRTTIDAAHNQQKP